jgi:GT2 family glycosyltransferase
MPKIDIVIVNWNSGELLRQTLLALAEADATLDTIDEVIVVDNASSDGSCAIDDIGALLPLHVIRNEINRGFAAACNQGAAAGRSASILFLNPDMLVPAGTLQAAERVLTEGKDQRIGVVGVRLTDAMGTVQRCTSRFPTAAHLIGQSLGLDRLLPGLLPPAFVTEWDHQDTRDVDQVMGAFLVIRRDLFETLGGFDERFFVYYDDVDLCLRVSQAGWRRLHYAEVSAVHRGHGTTDRIKDVRLFYVLRSRLLFASKHFGTAGTIGVWLATLLIEPWTRTVLLIARRAPLADVAALARGYILLYRALPTLRRQASQEAQPRQRRNQSA